MCDSFVALTLSHGKSIRRLCSNQNISFKALVVIPVNGKGNHWTLIAINCKEYRIIVLDPMANTLSEELRKSAIDIALPILKLKFEKSNLPVISSPEHVLQSDGMSCGVFVCFYIEQLIKGRSLKESIVVDKYRERIYNALVGNCSLYSLEKGWNQCKVCNKDLTDKTSWVKCARCPQWVHCNCVNMSLEQAKDSYHYCWKRLLYEL